MDLPHRDGVSRQGVWQRVPVPPVGHTGCRPGRPAAAGRPVGVGGASQDRGGAPDTKSAFAQVFGVAGRRVRVVSLHLDFAGGADHRVRQLTHLLDALERTDGAAGGAVEVLCGDFNTSGHYGSKGAAAQTQRVLDVALTRGFSDCSAGVPWTSDLFSSIDDADPARRWLAVGRALGLRYRQKLDHLLVRGTRRLATARVVAAPGHPHLPGSDHVPVAVELIL